MYKNVQNLLTDFVSNIGVLGWVIIFIMLFIVCQAIWRATEEKEEPPKKIDGVKEFLSTRGNHQPEDDSIPEHFD